MADTKGMSEENLTEIDDALPQQDSYTIEALKIIKEAQSTHGLRHQDFQRYRGYCARRIRRIRKSLHFPQGNKHRNVPKKITAELVTDAKFLYLPLVEAERCWSQAMQLKSESNTEPRKSFHKISRLKKAVQHTEDFVKLVESDKCDARTKLEAQAYHSWMTATLNFELANWKKAIEQFTSAKTIYEKLASALTEDVRVLYIQRVEEIAPNIRYCAYNIGDESAINDLVQMRMRSGAGDALTSRLDELISQTREKQASTFLEVYWRGRTVPVANEAVRAFLLQVQESDKELAEATDSDSKLSIYETLLKECIDVLQTLRDDLRNDPHFKAAQRGQRLEGKVSNVQYLHTHITHTKLSRTVERNLVMIDNMKANLKTSASVGGDETRRARPQDVARLYDIIIQSLSELPALPGLEEDEDIARETTMQIDAYKAHRCFYIAQTYALAKKWKEALALYERVLQYADTALKALTAATTTPKQKEIKSDLEELKVAVDSLKYSSHAASILDTSDLTDKMAATTIHNNKPLVDRLEHYVHDVNTKRTQLATFPPDFNPVPCKPLFFDLALNHVELPSIEEKLDANKQKAGGLTGFVKGWLWGGGKK